MTIITRLVTLTPELSDTERRNWFAPLPLEEQEELADLLWQCETPEARGLIYADLRRWWSEAMFGNN